MAINDTIQQRLQAQPIDAAQNALKNVAQTRETDPTQTVEELNQTAMALFMTIEQLKVLSQKVAALEQAISQTPTQEA